MPAWATTFKKYSNEKLYLEIKQELRFNKFPKENNADKIYNTLLCDILCKAELNDICEITLPIKENNKTKKLSCIGNLRVHPCGKIENVNLRNNSLRIIFSPKNELFQLCVSELEGIPTESIPILASLQLKESNQNEVKIYLKVLINDDAIGKFEYFNIKIPLKHFGIIYDTKIMVQVGEVTIIDKSTLLWNLENKVFGNIIVLSGTVYFRKESKVNKTEEYSSKPNIVVLIKEENNSLKSNIKDNNCFCKIAFKLNNFSLWDVDIDEKILFYPKISPNIEIKKYFVSEEYIVWNDLSFNNYQINTTKKEDLKLLEINIDEETQNENIVLEENKEYNLEGEEEIKLNLPNED